MSDLRERLAEVVQKGREAQDALSKLEALQKAENEDATVDDLRQAVGVAETSGDFETASRLKSRWIDALRKGGV